ncbi:MAG: NADH-quinone oxidoreductase subunit J [Cytophagaceae bacterium]|nr:NADH-quinone oxidoreductase subunit J [Cytophagaceae bacterium]
MLTLGSAVVVLLSRNVLYSAYSLLLTFVGIAALYVLAGADFLAVTQLMVYVGGVLVLLVFGVMLTHRGDAQKSVAQRATEPNVVRTNHGRTLAGVLVAGGMFALLFTVIQKADFTRNEATFYDPITRVSTVPDVGIHLMTDYALPFEVVGVLLLAALIGAAYLSSIRN